MVDKRQFIFPYDFSTSPPNLTFHLHFLCVGAYHIRFLGLPNKMPRPAWLTTEMHSLKSLEAEGLRSRCCRASLPWKAPEMDRSLPFLISGGCWQHWVLLAHLWLHSPVSAPCLRGLWLCVSLYGLLLVRMSAIGFRVHLNPVGLHLNSITPAKTLRSHSQVLQCISLGGHNSTQNTEDWGRYARCVCIYTFQRSSYKWLVQDYTEFTGASRERPQTSALPANFLSSAKNE